MPPPEAISGSYDAQQATSSLSPATSDHKGSVSGSTINLGESKAQQHLIACELQLIQLVIRYGQLPTLAPQTEVETPWSAAQKAQATEVVADSPLVAPFILEELTTDDIHLQLDKHQQILEEAVQQTLENPDTFNSRDYFITHPDQEINRLAAELADDRYPLSIEQQKAYVPEEKRLVDIVPRVINDYKHAILGVQKEEVLLALRQPELQQQPEKMNELLKQLIEINELEKQFAKVLGDRVLVR